MTVRDYKCLTCGNLFSTGQLIPECSRCGDEYVIEQSEVKQLQAEVKELRELVREIRPYIYHSNGCSSHDNYLVDTCSCKAGRLKRTAEKLLGDVKCFYLQLCKVNCRLTLTFRRGCLRRGDLLVPPRQKTEAARCKPIPH